MNRRIFLRYDLLIQAFFLVVNACILLSLSLGETWDDVVFEIVAGGLSGWIVLSMVVHTVWKIRTKETNLAPRLLVVFVGGVVFSFVLSVVISMALALFFTSFSSQSSTLLMSISLLGLLWIIAAAYAYVSYKDYKAPHKLPQTTSFSATSSTNASMHRLQQIFSFAMKKFLPFLFPNLLTLVGLFVWFNSFDEQLGEYNWAPVIISVVTLLIGLLVSKLVRTRTTPALDYAKLATRPNENVIAPATGFLKLYNQLFWVILIPLVLFGLTYLPPIRKALTIYDLRQVDSFESISMSPLQLAQKRTMYSLPLAPDVLNNRAVIAHHLEQLQQQRSAYYDFDKERIQLCLYYAALRLQGNSPQQIWELPMGKFLVVGTLLAENEPPYWWKKAEWLQQKLGCHPNETYHLGLIEPSFAREKLNELLQNKALLLPADSTTEAYRLAPVLLKALLNIAQCFPDLTTTTQKDDLLALWQEQYADPEFETSLARSLQIRSQVKALLQPYAHADGTLPIQIEVDSVAFSQVLLRQKVEKAFEQFVILCGFEPIQQTGVSLKINLIDTVHFVPYTTRDYKEIRVLEQKRVLVGTYRSSRYETRTVERKDYQAIDGSGRNNIHVPVMTLTIHGTTFHPLPYGIINKNNADRVAALLQEGKGQPDGPSDSYTKIIWYYYTLFNALTPWRYGIPYYEDPENQLFWDGFSEELEPSRF
ncbi:MAG: hypothetical protein U0Y10_11830 [Spirosomataceae bacterium]